MENFINGKIDTSNLPCYEVVELNKFEKSYWKVILLNLSAFVLLLVIAAIVLFFINEKTTEVFKIVFPLLLVLILIITGLLRLSFVKKAYAFRDHDVVYRNGVISTNTVVIPYNRVQHVALHEGWISRVFGLAAVEIFTAGGSASDIKIHGITKQDAENIKQLLMGKIQKQL